MCGRTKKYTIFANLSLLFLVSVNILIALGGLALIGGGGYVFANYAQDFDELISKNAIVYVIIAGTILLIFSLLAIAGALTGQNRFLIAYIVVLVIVIAAEVTVAILGLDYLGVIETTAAANNQTDLSATQTQINNFLLKSYHTCCFLEEDFCDPLPSDPGYCAPVLFCSEPGAIFEEVCIDSPPEDGKTVDQAVCTALRGFANSGNSIVGPAPESCGGGNPSVFLDIFSDTLISKLEVAGYGAIGLGVLEFLMIVFTMYLILGKKVKWNPREDEFAVAVAAPLDPASVDPASIHQSIGVDEEFRGSNGRKSRRIDAIPLPPPPAVEEPRKSRRLEEPVETRNRSPSIDRNTMQRNPNTIDNVL